ncbi:MAG: hypothetical protein C0602_13110 [Denitrovibrio sp.]|nr:MAG: hypothetical protein C0602_13110 [Denitrovibrio sp.]
MKASSLKQVQHLKTDIKTAWDFFSTPLKLAEITPDWLNFQIVSDVPETMYEGLIVQYNVHPFLSIPIGWTTEITHSKEPYFFVDEQRAGPYKLWHHQHHFKETETGVEMTDIVHYILPLEPFSRFLLGGIVSKKLDDIFSYRRKALDKKFNSKKEY